MLALFALVLGIEEKSLALVTDYCRYEKEQDDLTHYKPNRELVVNTVWGTETHF